MIGLEQWRAAIGAWHAGSLRAHRHFVNEKRRIARNWQKLASMHYSVYWFIAVLFAFVSGSVASALGFNVDCRYSQSLCTSVKSPGKVCHDSLQRFRLDTDSSFATTVRSCAVDLCRLLKLANPSLASMLRLLSALRWLLIVAGDVELNPGPVPPGITELLPTVDDSVLTEDDHFYVLEEVGSLAAKWRNMCLALGVLDADTIASRWHDPKECLTDVLKQWLKRSYTTQKRGPPTWRKLVEAVANNNGGDNPALAETIANKHQILQITEEPVSLENVTLGNPAEFVVKAIGKNLTYTWHRQTSKQLLPSHERVPVRNTQILHIDKVDSSHEGYYVCTISSPTGGTAETKPAQLTISHQIASKMPGGKDTWEYKTFFENQAKLADQLADTPGITVSLSNELYARQIIGMAVRDTANTHGPGITEIMRVEPILAAVLKEIEINPKRYDEFRASMLSSNVGVDSDVVNRFVPEKGHQITSMMPGGRDTWEYETLFANQVELARCLADTPGIAVRLSNYLHAHRIIGMAEANFRDRHVDENTHVQLLLTSMLAKIDLNPRRYHEFRAAMLSFNVGVDPDIVEAFVPEKDAGHRSSFKMPGGMDTWEYKTLFANQAKLADQLADTPGITVSLSNELYARQIIGMAVRDTANTHGPGITEIMRVEPILAAVLKEIEINPKRYNEFRDTMLSPNVDVDSDVVDRLVPEKGHQITSKMPGRRDTWEFKTFDENQTNLADYLADIPGITVSLSNELYTRQIIRKAVRDKANIRGPGVTEILRVQPILTAVLKEIEINPMRYEEFRAAMLSPTVGVDSDVVDIVLPEKGHQIASMMPGGKDTWEYETLFANQTELASELADTPEMALRLVNELLAKSIIERAVRDAADIRGPGVTEIMLVQPILTAMLAKIDLNPRIYHQFRAAMLSRSVSMDSDVVDELVPEEDAGHRVMPGGMDTWEYKTLLANQSELASQLADTPGIAVRLSNELCARKIIRKDAANIRGPGVTEIMRVQTLLTEVVAKIGLNPKRYHEFRATMLSPNVGVDSDVVDRFVPEIGHQITSKMPGGKDTWEYKTFSENQANLADHLADTPGVAFRLSNELYTRKIIRKAVRNEAHISPSLVTEIERVQKILTVMLELIEINPMRYHEFRAAMLMIHVGVVSDVVDKFVPEKGHQITSMMPGGKDTWEYETLFANQTELASELADTPGIAMRLVNELLAKSIIERAVRDAADIRGPGVTEIMRVQPILTAMLAKIDLNPRIYHQFRAAILSPNVGVDPDEMDRLVPEKDAGHRVMPGGMDTWEYKTLLANQAELASRLARTPGIAVRLSNELYTHKIIRKAVRNSANIPGPEITRVQPILTEMVAKIGLNPKRYHVFRAIINNMLSPDVGVDSDVVDRFLPEKGHRIASKRPGGKNTWEYKTLFANQAELASHLTSSRGITARLSNELYTRRIIEKADRNYADKSSSMIVQVQTILTTMLKEIDHNPRRYDEFRAAMLSPEVGVDPDVVDAFVPEKGIEQEIDEEDKKHLEEAMKEGYISARVLKVIFTGAGGVGKTHTVCLLCGADPPSSDRQSTDCTNKAITLRVDATNNDEWEKIDVEKRLKIIAKGICAANESAKIKKEQQHVPLPEPEPEPKQKVQPQPLEPKPERKPEQKVQSQRKLEQKAQPQPSNPKPKPDQEPEQEAQRAQQLETQQAPQLTTPLVSSLPLESESNLLKNIHKVVMSGEVSGEILGIKWVYVVDTGGQPPFHELLSAFIKGTSACAFVFKLSESLDHRPLVEYWLDGKEVGKPFEHPLSNRQILEQSIQTIQALPSLSDECSKSPLLFVIGTHRDEQDKCTDETLEDKERTLHEIMEQSGCKCQYNTMDIHDNTHSGEQRIVFDVNAKNPEQRDKDIAAALRREIANIMPEPEKIPLRHYGLELELEHLATVENKGVISMEECRTIRDRLSFDENSLKRALRFLHRVNVLLYYPEVKEVEELIFCDPLFLMKIVSKVVQHIHKGSSTAWKESRKSGSITIEQLDTDEFRSCLRSEIFTFKSLFKLFEHLLIVAKVKETDQEFFMPCLLDDATLDETTRISRPNSHCSPLVFQFYKGRKPVYAPCGLFSALVAFLLSSWTIEVDSESSGNIYRNIITFRSSSPSAHITLINFPTRFEVFAKCHQYNHLKNIRSFLLKGLKEVKKVRNFEHVVYKETFRCKCTEAKESKHPHLANIQIEEKSWYCPLDPMIGGHLEISELAWFKEVPQVMRHPISQKNVTLGSDVEFKVEATGTDLSYTWYHQTSEPNRKKKIGGNNETLHISEVKSDAEGDYVCTISNLGGVTVDTEPARLTTTPEIIEKPRSQENVTLGSDVEFVVKATGMSLSYAWYHQITKRTSKVKVGENNPTLHIDKVKSADEGYYTCTIGNPTGGTAKTPPAQLTTAPGIIQKPESQRNVTLGSTVEFVVKATGMGLSYTWYHQTAKHSSKVGENNPTLCIDKVKSADEGYYTCTIGNPTGGTETTPPAQLKITCWSKYRLLIVVSAVAALVIAVLVAAVTTGGLGLSERLQQQNNTALSSQTPGQPEAAPRPGSQAPTPRGTIEQQQDVTQERCTVIDSIMKVNHAIENDISDWRLLGEELGITSTVLDRINKDQHEYGDLHKLRATIREWKKGSTEDAFCWEKLIDALKLMNQINLAERISKQYIKWKE